MCFWSNIARAKLIICSHYYEKEKSSSKKEDHEESNKETNIISLQNPASRRILFFSALAFRKKRECQRIF